MKQRNLARILLAAAAMASPFIQVAQAANTDIKITEWMYKPVSGSGEFIELTNTGNSAIDLTGWSQDDSNRTTGVHLLSAFGTIAAGESVILTEIDPNTFRTNWNLSSSVKVINYGSSDSLGSSDEINIFDNHGTLIDRLTYGVTGPSTSGKSGRPGSLAALGANNSALWVLSSVGDVEGSHASTLGDIGSPGHTSYAPAVPIGSTDVMMLSALGFLAPLVRRKMKNKAA